MKKLLVLVLVTCVVSAQAQLHKARSKPSFLSFFRIKGSVPDFRTLRNSARLTTLTSDNFISSNSYWQGATYTSYSENGRIRTTHSFDVAGVLRETKSSISLRREGRWSYWRIQFSTQRTRPYFVYTIH